MSVGTFDEAKHEYRINGRLVPHVTKVLADLLPGFRASDWYLQRGRAVHACAAMVGRGIAFDHDPRITGQVEANKRLAFAEVDGTGERRKMNHLRDLPEYRYRTDATFHTLVDSLEALLIYAQLTPSDIREAAVLAAIHHEERSMRREDFVKRDRAQTALEVLETSDANQAREREIDNRTAQEINERRADDERMRHDS